MNYPSGKPEIWWAMRGFEPGQVSPEWVCTVAQNWSKAREALPEFEDVRRADDWREAMEGVPGFPLRLMKKAARRTR